MLHIHIRYSILTVLLMVSAFALAQAPQKEAYLLKGRLVDADSGTAVSLAHIANVSQRTITAAKADGAFTLPVQGGDTLLISRIGYVPLRYPVPLQEPMGAITLLLQPLTEELREVVITQMPSERRFKEQLLGLQLPEEKEPNLQVPHPSTMVTPRLDGAVPLVSAGGLISGFANKFNTKERGRQFTARIKAEESQKAYIATKFNRDIAQRITGLEDEEQLNEFMKFCVLPDKFLLESSEYQIHETVLGCFKEFLAER
ncbi:carboxypeptidase-like regulatory domain-containing protein [Cesiribacter andamanensis]|uniref:TonB-linked outer membrane protein, SusC/RagA family n=1 Tax=Cesiribacter andamanensis AMV16 TaxID=1279009 RepID=M7N211_9BACT|nr:carboxypeptidase-like regulatory domain-containing protein [Cesiribacter andamanensis]EMR01337.1 TonB-linked outer membrane protein, SusC/RagA family [Cesiribacter andamanensis AMV16]